MNEKKKIYIMQISIVIIAIFLFSLWIFNLNNVFYEDNNFSHKQDYKSLSETIKQVTDDTKSRLRAIKLPENKNSVVSSNIVQKMIKSVNVLASSTSVDNSQSLNNKGSSIATPINNKQPKDNVNSCPAWINCMPRIGSSPPDCTIPVGCENITQIAY